MYVCRQDAHFSCIHSILSVLVSHFDSSVDGAPENPAPPASKPKLFQFEDSSKGHGFTITDSLTVEKTATDYEVPLSHAIYCLLIFMTVCICYSRVHLWRALLGSDY